MNTRRAFATAGLIVVVFTAAEAASARVTLEVVPAWPKPADAITITVEYVDYPDCFEPFVLQEADRISVEIPCNGPVHLVGKDDVTTSRLEVEIDPLPAGIYAVEVATNRPLGPANVRRVVASRALTVAADAMIVTDARLDPPAPDDLDSFVAIELTTCSTAVLTQPVFAGRTIIVRGHREPFADLPFPFPAGTCRPDTVVKRLHLGQLLPGAYTLAVLGDGEVLSEENRIYALFDFEVVRAANEVVAIGERGRFAVQANWTRPNGTSGPALGRLLDDADDSATFWFFRPGNRELMVKVLDGCASNGFYWVFIGGLTNLGVEITVSDLEVSRSKQYESPLGTPFAPRLDTRAFACE